jgi:hypothetical protein
MRSDAEPHRPAPLGHVLASEAAPPRPRLELSSGRPDRRAGSVGAQEVAHGKDASTASPETWRPIRNPAASSPVAPCINEP